jgi:hypothetical protein
MVDGVLELRLDADEYLVAVTPQDFYPATSPALSPVLPGPFSSTNSGSKWSHLESRLVGSFDSVYAINLKEAQ